MNTSLESWQVLSVGVGMIILLPMIVMNFVYRLETKQWIWQKPNEDCETTTHPPGSRWGEP